METLQQRVAELEKEVAELKGQVSAQPQIDELTVQITNRLQEALLTPSK